ncbi:MAG: hypothetical protein ACE5G0_02595 [Rhodothermales bacterium]
MKLHVTMIDWEYPADRIPPAPETWNLHHEHRVMELYLAFANGIIIEFKAEADSTEALAVLLGVVRGAGACVPATLSAKEKEKLLLYEDGFDCYTQGSPDCGYVFINPIPQPHKFEPLDDGKSMPA